MIDGKTFFDQLINILTLTTGEGDDYTTVYLLGFIYFEEHCKVKAIDLSKQQVLDADLKAMQTVKVNGNLYQQEIKKSKEYCGFILL